MNRKVLKKISKVLMMSFTLLLLATASVFAQNVVTGKVTDNKDGSPAAGITVTEKGTRNATQTRNDGSFSIKAPATATLVFSSVSFDRKEVAVNGQNSISLGMAETVKQGSEIVVVAYGTRKKSDLTGAITAVSSKDFQKGAVASPEQLLQGKVAGLQITNGGGSAGGGSTIRIRGSSSINGSNDPLIVIDGVPVEGNGVGSSQNILNTINPNDIESISVLKDAAATALYGNRASNGVILITSKKGTRGKLKFNYSNLFSASQVASYAKVLTADQIRSIVNADAVATGSNNYKNSLGKANTDWQKQIYQVGIGDDNNLSVSGAIGKALPFRLSGGYTTQTGVLKTDKFQRGTVSLNLNPTKLLNDHLSVNINAKTSQTNQRMADGNAVTAAASFDPTQALTQVNNYGGNYEWLNGSGVPLGTNGGAGQPNPLSLLQFRHNTAILQRLIGSVQIDYKVHSIPNLHVLINGGLDLTKATGDDNTDSISVTQYGTKGRFTHNQQKNQNQLLETSLFYTKDLKNINSKFDVLVGHTYQDFYNKSYNYASYGQKGNLIAGSTPNFALSPSEHWLDSYLGRLNFTLNDKYLLTASVRRDKTSRFSSDNNNNVGIFPSVAVGWKLKEDFFKNSNVVSDLKLRASWGQTGNENIGSNNYPYQQIYALGTSTSSYQLGTGFVKPISPNVFNSKIKWETTATSNIGLDFGFLKNRISGSFDLFYKNTTNLIANQNIPFGQNFDIILGSANVGTMETRGAEFAINTIPVKKGKIEWDLGFNVSYNKSKITSLGDNLGANFVGYTINGLSIGTGATIGINKVDYAPNTFYTYKQVYDPTTGNPIQSLYSDTHRNGTNGLYTNVNPSPKALFGINTQLIVERWSLGVSAHGMIGNYMYNEFQANASLSTIQSSQGYISNVSTNYLKTGFTTVQPLSDYYIQNASFLRLDVINVGFDAGKIFNDKATLHLTLAVQNAFVITKYQGLDPENSSSSGIDNNIYPRPRVFSIGASLGF